MNDIEIIYEAVRDKYDLVLTNSLELDDGFTWNVPIIVGQTSIGRFWLYADGDVLEPQGLEFVFSVDAEYEKQTLFGKKTVKYRNHWQPHPIFFHAMLQATLQTRYLYVQSIMSQ